MGERLAIDQPPFIEGRGGVLIPVVDTEELGPNEFLQFFRDILQENKKAYENQEIDFYYSQAFPFAVDFVIPSSDKSPLVLMRYTRSGSQNSFGDEATHEILTEPLKPGGFDSFLRICHPIGLGSLVITPPNEEYLEFHARRAEPDTWLGPKGAEASTEQRQTLGRLVADFVELVS